MSILLRGVEVDGRTVDVRLDRGAVYEVGPLVPGTREEVDDRGGTLLPGLHDHHLHLLALAAARASVDVSGGLDILRGAAGGGWLRAVGLATDADRHVLDAVVPDRPVRVQHRGGGLWVLNTLALQALSLDGCDHPGVERDASGELTGRLWRADDLLASLLGRTAPDLSEVDASLARFGITGVTDATPDLDSQTCELLRTGVRQRVMLLGDPTGSGPYKVVLSDHELPSLSDLVARLRSVRPRPVAVHSVTRESLVLLLKALEAVGRHPGDRVEHASVVPVELAADLPTVVTQPGFVAARGDHYLRDVLEQDVPDLYRYGSLLEAGCTVVPSSDAPYGPLDPWSVLRAARDRRTARGFALGLGECVEVSVALDGMLRPLADLTLPARRVVPGAAADLVLLEGSTRDVLAEPDASRVRATWIGGVRVFDATT